MASKRHSPLCVPPADDNTPKKSRAACAAPAASIDILPLDLLAEIFAYALHEARLRAISPVCKRWRAAALRSIKSYGSLSSMRMDALERALPLFPSLTHLTMAVDVPFYVLPTTLQSLELLPPYLWQAIAKEENCPTFLSLRFPKLTALHIDANFAITFPRYASIAPLRNFLSTHSTQLTSLTLGSVSELLTSDLMALPWPQLRTFVCRPIDLAQWTPPALKELSLHISDPAELMSLPAQILATLTKVDFVMGAPDDAVLAWLGACTSLRAITVVPPLMLLPESILPESSTAVLCRLLTNYDLYPNDKGGWQWLCQLKALRELTVWDAFSGLPASLPLALERVVIHGWPGGGGIPLWPHHLPNQAALSAVETLTFAILLLRVCPSIRDMSICVSKGLAGDEPLDGVRLAPLVEELVAEGLAVGLADLSINFEGDVQFPCAMPLAVRLGWMPVQGITHHYQGVQ